MVDLLGFPNRASAYAGWQRYGMLEVTAIGMRDHDRSSPKRCDVDGHASFQRQVSAEHETPPDRFDFSEANLLQRPLELALGPERHLASQ
jgi:hypothetical protein